MKTFLSFVVVVFLALSASAQNSDVYYGKPSNTVIRVLGNHAELGAVVVPAVGTVVVQSNAPKVEVFGGYSFHRVEGVNFNGVNAAASYNFLDNLGVVGDYSLNFGPADSTYQTLTFGPQYSVRKGSYTLFGRGLVAGSRLGVLGSSGYAFTLGGGGGVDFKVTDSISVRAVQVDYLGHRNNGAYGDGFRVSTGFVFGK